MASFPTTIFYSPSTSMPTSTRVWWFPPVQVWTLRRDLLRLANDQNSCSQCEAYWGYVHISIAIPIIAATVTVYELLSTSRLTFGNCRMSVDLRMLLLTVLYTVLDLVPARGTVWRKVEGVLLRRCLWWQYLGTVGLRCGYTHQRWTWHDTWYFLQENSVSCLKCPMQVWTIWHLLYAKLEWNVMFLEARHSPWRVLLTMSRIEHTLHGESCLRSAQ